MLKTKFNLLETLEEIRGVEKPTMSGNFAYFGLNYLISFTAFEDCYKVFSKFVSNLLFTVTFLYLFNISC